MRIRDLGHLDGDVLVYGGPYSNLQATRALMDRADELGIEPGARICTGDVVAYCADPVKTVRLARERAGPVLAGNVEEQLAAGALDCGCGFDEGTACDLLSAGWYSHASRSCDAELRAWMASLPSWIVFSAHGRRWLTCHGSPGSVNRFLWPDTPDPDLVAEIALAEAQSGPIDGILSGHSGIPFIRDLGRYVWVNAGAIGMPPHDGRPETRFAIIGPEGPRIEALAYDHRAAAQAMRDAGLTQGYHTALLSGFWPSEDILPPTMRLAHSASG